VTIIKNDILEKTEFNVDGIVKSRFKDWIPAFAGMTYVVYIKLVRFAHNWNNGTVEMWNDGFKENEV